MTLTGPFLTLDVPNRNGRTYKTETMQHALATITEPIFGQIEPGERSSIDLSKITHMCTNLRVENGQCVADIKVLGTPGGLALETILKSDNENDFGFRPRGIGNVGDDGVISDYQLISIDYVRNPA